MPVKREIVYPFFLECCQYADDIFWENVFEDLAYGKPPYGTYISKGFLCCSFKNKEFSYKIERKEESKILYDDIYSLLTEKIGILSHKEKARKKLDFHELENTIKQSRQEWCNIRRKNIKDIMYEKYVIDMQKKHSLSIKNCKYLLSVILLSIIFKTITIKDIIYKDDRIQSIEGIDFSKDKVILKRALCLDEEITPEIEDEKSTLMSDNWNRYLKLLREQL